MAWNDTPLALSPNASWTALYLSINYLETWYAILFTAVTQRTNLTLFIKSSCERIVTRPKKIPTVLWFTELSRWFPNVYWFIYSFYCFFYLFGSYLAGIRWHTLTAAAKARLLLSGYEIVGVKAQYDKIPNYIGNSEFMKFLSIIFIFES